MPSASFVFPVRYVSEGVAVQTTSRELSALGIAVRSLAPPHVGSRVSMALNTFLLFVILFYVYPLKYVFTLFTQEILGHPSDVPASGAPLLYTVYGIGVTSVFWLLAGTCRD